MEESSSEQMARQIEAIWGLHGMMRDDYNSKIQDFADLCVARVLSFIEEGCQMHNEDKVGSEAIGVLVKTKNKVEQNAFPAAVALIKMMREWAKHFVYENRRNELHTACDYVHPPAPKLKICIDKSKTRIAATKEMLTPMIRMHRGLKAHRDQHRDAQVCQVNDGSIKSAAELEGILWVTKKMTTLAQHERACNGGFKVKGFEITEDHFDPHIGHVPMIDLDSSNNGAGTKIKRIEVHRDDLTAIGKEAFDRAQKATKHRHSMKGSTLNQRDYIATGLELRLIGRDQLSDDTKEKAEIAVKEEYERYAKLFNPENAAGEEEEDVLEANVTFVGGLPDLRKKNKKERKKGEAPEFEDAWSEWLDLSRSMKFKDLFKKELAHVDSEEELDPIQDLLTLNMLKVYRTLVEDPDEMGFFETYGYLPKLSLCYIGANLASSFCERVNSCAKNIMTHDRTLLSDTHLEKLCFLRMNRDIIYYLKAKYPSVMRDWESKQHEPETRPEPEA